MVPKNEHAPLTWKYGQASRATAVSNDQMDLYKDRIREMYLDQNLSRKEVTRQLEKRYGFSISPDQFSKATNRWGFSKQPRKKAQSAAVPTTSRITLLHKTQLTQASPDTSLSEDSGSHSEASKRPRSTGSATSDAALSYSNTSSLSSSRPAKRYRQMMADVNDGAETGQDLDDALTIPTIPIADLVRLDTSKPFPIATLDTPEDSTDTAIPKYSFSSAVDMDKLCAEFLDSCYLFKRAFSRYAKTSVPFNEKTSSSKERRCRILDLARTARSRSTRKVACVMLESELKISCDPLDLSQSEEKNQVSLDKMAPHESFLFRRYLAQIYSYHCNAASEVHVHLDKAGNFLDKYMPAHSSRGNPIDLWTLQHLSEGGQNPSISSDLVDALGGNLPLVITPCLLWCKKHLLQMNGSANDQNMLKDIRKIGADPTSVSRWRIKWNNIVLWAYSSQLFAHLWHDLQIYPPAIDDTLIWLNEEFLAGISVTHFLMIVCRMIIDESRFFVPSPRDKLNKPQDDDLGIQGARPSFDIPGCLRAIDKIISDGKDSPKAATNQFVSQFCRHHSWATPMRRKNKFVQQVQAELLEHLRATVKLMNQPRIKTPTPLTPPAKTEWWGDVLDILVDNPEFYYDRDFENLAKRASRISEGIPSILMEMSWERASSIASGSTASFRAHQAFFSALQGTSAFTKPMTRSSWSSEASRASSLQRFRAAGRIISKIPSLLRSPRGSTDSDWEMHSDWDSDLLAPPPLMGVVDEGQENMDEDDGMEAKLDPDVSNARLEAVN